MIHACILLYFLQKILSNFCMDMRWATHVLNLAMSVLNLAQWEPSCLFVCSLSVFVITSCRGKIISLKVSHQNHVVQDSSWHYWYFVVVSDKLAGKTPSVHGLWLKAKQYLTISHSTCKFHSNLFSHIAETRARIDETFFIKHMAILASVPTVSSIILENKTLPASFFIITSIFSKPGFCVKPVNRFFNLKFI